MAFSSKALSMVFTAPNSKMSVLNFIIKKPCDRILLQAKRCKSKDIERLVKELRKQALINKNKLENE